MRAPLPTDEDRVAGGDHNEIIHADGRDDPAAGVDVVPVRIPGDHGAPERIPVGVRGRQPDDLIPRADVAPAEVPTHDEDPLRLFHHAVVD